MMRIAGRFLWILVVFLGGCSFLDGKSQLSVQRQTFSPASSADLSKSESIEYCLLSFKDGYVGENFPLVVVLHGSGDNGCNYLQLWKRDAKEKRFMILAPSRKHPFRNAKPDHTMLKQLVGDVLNSYPADHGRVYLIGVSSGALVAQWLLSEGSDQWQGAVLVASVPNMEWARTVDVSRLPPILYAHGAADEQAKLADVEAEAKVLSERGAKVKMYVDPEGGHLQDERWNADILAWLDTLEKNSVSASK